MRILRSGRVRAGVKGAAVVVVLAGVFMAGRMMATTTAATSVSKADYLSVEARQGEVGSSFSTSGTLAWTVSQRLDVPAHGRVTKTIPSGGAMVRSGETVLEVDGQPVVVIPGETAAYRDLTLGSSGPDVAAWQRFLRQSGHPAVPTNGTFDSATQKASRSWLATLGIDGDGTVPLGAVVFVPSLPARVVPDQALRLGAELPSPAFAILDPNPTLTLRITSAMAPLIKAGIKVSLAVGDRTIDSTMSGAARPTSSGELRAPVDVGPLQCTQVSCPGTVSAPAMIQAEIEVVPRTKGVVVPVTAITTVAGGTPQITMADGSVRTVTLGPSSDGLVVVTGGVKDGEKVRIPVAGS